MSFLRRVGWLNVLLVFVPVALFSPHGEGYAAWVFVASAVAIIPLAGLMGKATENLSVRFGPGVSGLLNASFGNAAELIIALFALRKGLVEVVKASITGSILGNVLLVLGASLLAGGLKYPRQTFNSTAAGVAATMLALAATGLVVPAVFHAYLPGHQFVQAEHDLSLEISVVLFAAYLLMLVFSLKTHRHLYDPSLNGHDSASRVPAPSPATSTSPLPVDPVPAAEAESDEEHWSVRTSLIVLVAATVGVSVMSERLVGAIEAASAVFGWTPVFVGVIVVAIVGNAAEHSTAILVAMKNHMELAVQIAIGSGIQIALFVAPLLVFVSCLPGFTRLNLVFTMLEVAAVVVSVILIALVVRDGESNWIEGLMLLAVYLIFAIAFYNLPPMEELGHPPAPETSMGSPAFFHPVKPPSIEMTLV
ncbi:MAG: calcium/proton exchanger [Planctomycetaceae bacterium]|nr:calcium/proton exchanger [Planctomycetaceae bacterium]